MSKNDEKFFLSLPQIVSVDPDIKIQIPNLLEACEKNAGSASYKFYTQAMCIEYHILLCYLLTKYSEHIHILAQDPALDAGDFASHV